ncbi:hypothetical protein GTY70_10450 [Stenotrophomonas maltophilia]|nr:hypothetical protein [Stenotrophomonas maltophilia]MCF3483355.1 hypothetical protein [Stenotrophomonas maltophilia]MCF3508824.1 hypothetical protein [Stenotrophomonas maltophilia]
MATRRTSRRPSFHSARFEQDAEDAKAWLVERGLPVAQSRGRGWQRARGDAPDLAAPLFSLGAVRTGRRRREGVAGRTRLAGGVKPRARLATGAWRRAGPCGAPLFTRRGSSRTPKTRRRGWSNAACR